MGKRENRKLNTRPINDIGIRVTPKSLNLFRFVPLGWAVSLAQKRFAMPHMEVMAARHARNARDEMGWLYGELMEFIGDAGVGVEGDEGDGKGDDVLVKEGTETCPMHAT